MTLRMLLTAFITGACSFVSLSQVTLDVKERPKPTPTFSFNKISTNPDFFYVLGVEDKSEKSVYYIEKYNSKTLNLEYQKNLNICGDDKDAQVHPAIVPPVCFEINNEVLAFYNSYLEKDKGLNVNVKYVNRAGEVNPNWKTLISSKDIEVQLDGHYWKEPDPVKPAIRYYLSGDKSTILIYVNSKKYNKIFSYKTNDLLAGKNQHKELDISELIKLEKIAVNELFFVNNKVCFSYTKETSRKTKDFGMAVANEATGKFELVKAGLAVSDIFSEDYYVNTKENKILISGFLRSPIDSIKSMSIANSKVKQFYLQFNTNSFGFEKKEIFPFLPSVAKYLSVPEEAYGFIEKTQTPDHYLNQVALLESPDYYFKISHLVLFMSPPLKEDPMRRGYFSYNASGLSTVCRDILVSKFDKSGKLLNQYLMPFHTSHMNGVVSGRWDAIRYLTNKVEHFNYILKGNDLHFFYVDSPKNTPASYGDYNPRNTKSISLKNNVLIDMSLKGNAINREVLIEKDNNCIFYSGQNLMIDNSVILDLEAKGINTEIGRVIVN